MPCKSFSSLVGTTCNDSDGKKWITDDDSFRYKSRAVTKCLTETSYDSDLCWRAFGLHTKWKKNRKNKHSLWLTPPPENVVQYIFAGDMSPPLFETTSFIPNIFF